MTYNVLITTIGRRNLNTLLTSLHGQLDAGDFLTVVSDKNHQASYDILRAHIGVLRCTISYHANMQCLGYFGHASRNLYQNKLNGMFIHNADDDNIYTPGAFAKIREVVTDQKKCYIFKHTSQITTIWQVPGLVKLGNIDTSCGIVPNSGILPEWALQHGGDGMFYERIAAQGVPFEFVDFEISKYNSQE